MEKVLIDQVKEAANTPALMELIKENDFLLWFETDTHLTRIDKELIDVLKKYYSKLGLTELRMLWIDNYNSMMIQQKEIDNPTSYLVRNKTLALGTLINQLTK